MSEATIVLEEYYPLSLVQLEDPNHDPGEHQVMDEGTSYIFKIVGDRDRAEAIVSTLNDYAKLQSELAAARKALEELRQETVLRVPRRLSARAHLLGIIDAALSSKEPEGERR